MRRDILVSIEQETCIGCGQCQSFAEEVFGFEAATGPASVYESGVEVPEALVTIANPNIKKVIQAARECPVKAIKTTKTKS